MNKELKVEVAPKDLIVGKQYFVKQLIPEDRYYGKEEFAVEHNTTYIATVKSVSEANSKYSWPWKIELIDLKPLYPASDITRKFYTTEGKIHNHIPRSMQPVFYKYDMRLIEALREKLGSSPAKIVAKKVGDYLSGENIADLLRATRKGGGTRKRKTGKKSKTGKKGKKSKTGKKGKK